MSEAQSDLNELKERFEAQQRQFQTYKAQCKQIEEFLEQQSQRKEAEIKKLKEQAIKKEKNHNLLKTQVSQLETQCTTLKAELKEKEGEPQPAENDSMQTELTKLKKDKESLKESLDNADKKLKQTAKENQELNSLMAVREKELLEKKGQVQGLKKSIEDLQEKLRQQQQQSAEKSEQKPAVFLVQKKEVTPPPSAQKNNGNSSHDGQIKKLQQKLVNSLSEGKQMKMLIQNLSTENKTLKFKLKQATNSLKQSKVMKEMTDSQDEIFIADNSVVFKPTVSCLMLTKRHYISPFLQIKDKNHLKLLKSTKSGVFEKSLGSIKYKLDNITYDVNELIEQTVTSIQKGSESETNNEHTVLIYGVKKSSKKYLMAALVGKLKELIEGKATECETIKCSYVKRSTEEEKNAEFHANSKQELAEIIERVLQLGHKNVKKSQGVIQKKGASKPKVRHFYLSIDDWSLEIATSSHVQPVFRENMTLHDMFNHVLYSKLPNALQSLTSTRHLILTVNPIVNLYEQCRNTLNMTLCKEKELPKESEDWSNWRESPVRDELNESARKKFQHFEKETQQSSLRMRRVEEECLFFRVRFEELEVRLKGLLNIHQPQNNYLKKSPVTLSYEKMLKLVQYALGRSYFPNAAEKRTTIIEEDTYSMGQAI